MFPLIKLLWLSSKIIAFKFIYRYYFIKYKRNFKLKSLLTSWYDFVTKLRCSRLTNINLMTSAKVSTSCTMVAYGYFCPVVKNTCKFRISTVILKSFRFYASIFERNNTCRCAWKIQESNEKCKKIWKTILNILVSFNFNKEKA